jgi:hypothetical protein
VFPDLSRAVFAATYPEGAHKMSHNFLAHPLFDLDALLGELEAEIAATWREDLRAREANVGLGPGEAAYVPVGAHHRVANWAQPSMSLAIK